MGRPLGGDILARAGEFGLWFGGVGQPVSHPTKIELCGVT